MNINNLSHTHHQSIEPSFDAWVQQSFGSSEAQVIFEVMRNTFFQAHSFDFWSTRGVIFQNGKGFVTTEKGEELDKITQAANLVIQSNEISFKERYAFFHQTRFFFKDKKESFAESKIPLRFQFADLIDPLELEIPFSLYLISSHLQNLELEEKSSDFVLPKPEGISSEDFKGFLSIFKKHEKPSYGILKGMQMLKIAEMLAINDQSFISSLITAARCTSLAELEYILNNLENLSLKAGERIVSKAISTYIDYHFSQGISIEQMFESWLVKGEIIFKSPLSLDLERNPHHRGYLKEADLNRLAALFPSVEVLSIRGTYVSTLESFPSTWTQSLRYLAISSTSITKIPKLPQLEIFDAVNSKILKEIDNLDDLKNLRRLFLDETCIERVPTGCLNLEIFSASYCKELVDINGLNESKKLRVINVSSTKITNAPHGCTNLEKFEATHVSQFNDIKELDGLEKLREVYLDFTAIERAPLGCTLLETFSAMGCKNLRVAEGLKSSKNLKIVRLYGTLVYDLTEELVNQKR